MKFRHFSFFRLFDLVTAMNESSRFEFFEISDSLHFEIVYKASETRRIAKSLENVVPGLTYEKLIFMSRVIGHHTKTHMKRWNDLPYYWYSDVRKLRLMNQLLTYVLEEM